MKYGIQQTKEILVAGLSILASMAAAKAEDGKISRTEALSIVFQSTGEVWTAVAGAGEVLPELADLDNSEISELLQATLASQAWPSTPKNIKIIETLYEGLTKALEVVRLIQAADPLDAA